MITFQVLSKLAPPPNCGMISLLHEVRELISPPLFRYVAADNVKEDVVAQESSTHIIADCHALGVLSRAFS